MLIRFAWLPFVVVCLQSSAHTEREARRMVERGLADSSRLIVKWRDDATRQTEPAIRLNTAFEATPLFRRGAETYRAERRLAQKRTGETQPWLENYRLLNFGTPRTAQNAVEILRETYRHPDVEFAYFEPRASNAVEETGIALPETRQRSGDYEAKQFHLEAPPTGVNARWAWEQPGGAGYGVSVIDIENGWNYRHEDFSPPFWQNISPPNADHGTAVWGEIAATRDDRGVSGIAHEVRFGTAAFSSAATYDLAASQLEPGDILVIEQHNYGPDNNKFTAMEYWQANFDAFKAITAKGVVVIAAAGNGDSNFDAPVYQGKFDLKKRDSGSILVGAGAPPGTSHLERLSFSNYGARVDAFAYGRNVVTTGYGDLFNGGPHAQYTAKFSGTSSATPIVVGAAASLLGIGRAHGMILTPTQVRAALRATGTKQKGNTTQRIGNLPDIKALTAYFGW